MSNKHFKLITVLLFGVSLTLGSTSCVHQFPNVDELDHNVYIHVLQETEWLEPDYQMTLTRSGETDNLNIRYDFRVYHAGKTSMPVREFSVFSSDLRRPDFYTSLALNPGDYDLYVWSDYAETSTGDPIFYDDSDFSHISYIKPYTGDTDLRDTFRGMTSFSVKASYSNVENVEAEVTLRRPMARYKFIATDLADFIDRETTRGMLMPPENQSDNKTSPEKSPQYAKLSDYKVKIIYPMYMPAVFDNFQNNPIDSWTGVSFDCRMNQLSEDEAQLGMDYVYVNGEESGVQVMLEVYDPKGTLIARTNTVTVPTKRNRTTLIFGKFLTTLRSDGVGINPDFDGEFNIEIP